MQTTNHSEREPWRLQSQNWTASRCSYRSPGVGPSRWADGWSGFASRWRRWCLPVGSSLWHGRPGTSRWMMVVRASAWLHTWGWYRFHSWCTAPGYPGSSPWTLQCRQRQSTIIDIILQHSLSNCVTHTTTGTPTTIYMNAALVKQLKHRQDRQCSYDLTLLHLGVTIFSVKKKRIIYSEYVPVALVIQHVKRMRSITL